MRQVAAFQEMMFALDDSRWNPKDPDAARRVKELGTIRVSMSRAIFSKFRDHGNPPNVFEEHGSISEKALKGKALSAKARCVHDIPLHTSLS
jgi:hypothetical protein